MTDPHSPLDLVRRYEPVLRYTAGELFFPMPVHDYLARASLWMTSIGEAGAAASTTASSTRTGWPTAARDHPDAALFLRYAPASLPRDALTAWRQRPDRPAVPRRVPAGRGRPARPVHRLRHAAVADRPRAGAGRSDGGVPAAVRQDRAATRRLPRARQLGRRLRRHPVLVPVRDERLALQLQRRQRPRGRLGAGHHLPGAGRRRQSGDRRGSRSPRTTRPATSCAGVATTRTSPGSTAPIRW